MQKWMKSGKGYSLDSRECKRATSVPLSKIKLLFPRQNKSTHPSASGSKMTASSVNTSPAK